MEVSLASPRTCNTLTWWSVGSKISSNLAWKPRKTLKQCSIRRNLDEGFPWKSPYLQHIYLKLLVKLIVNYLVVNKKTSHWGAFVQPLLQWRSNKNYIFWVCICSLGYAACNAHAPYYIVIRGLPGCTIFFSTLCHKQHDLKKNISIIKCVFWFSLQVLSETFLILRRTERDVIKKMYFGLHVKYRYYGEILMERIFTTDFSKYAQISSLTKNLPVRTELLHADGETVGQTDRHEDGKGRFTHSMPRPCRSPAMPCR
jgi:hypothetical protein